MTRAPMSVYGSASAAFSDHWSRKEARVARGAEGPMGRKSKEACVDITCWVEKSGRAKKTSESLLFDASPIYGKDMHTPPCLQFPRTSAAPGGPRAHGAVTSFHVVVGLFGPWFCPAHCSSTAASQCIGGGSGYCPAQRLHQSHPDVFSHHCWQSPVLLALLPA